MAPISKIHSHPDKDEIIQRLTTGESVRDVEAWIASKYPARTQTHLRVSSSTIQNFKSDFLNLKGQVLQDIKDAALLTKETIKYETQLADVQATNSYQEKINSIAQERLDQQRELIEIFHILKSRAEYFYNKLETSDFSDKQEKAFQKYLDQMIVALEQYKKYVEGHQEVTRHDVNINIMSDQVSLIRESVREILSDLDPALAVKFMASLSAKMRNLSYHRTDDLTSNIQLVGGNHDF